MSETATTFIAFGNFAAYHAYVPPRDPAPITATVIGREVTASRPSTG